jgi:hypothetical protein
MGITIFVTAVFIYVQSRIDGMTRIEGKVRPLSNDINLATTKETKAITKIVTQICRISSFKSVIQDSILEASSN